MSYTAPSYRAADDRYDKLGDYRRAGNSGLRLPVFSFGLWQKFGTDHSPLAQGLLTDKYLAATIPAGARAQDSAFLTPDVIDDTYRERATALGEIARQRGQSLAQLALQWVLRQPEVSSALIGASSTWQLDHNLKAVDFPPLTDEELALIDRYGVHGTGLGV